MNRARPFLLQAALWALCIPPVSANSPRSQTQSRADAPATSSFEVASIKVDNSGSGRHSLSMDMDGGRLRAINVSLAGLMTGAYEIPANRILGAPAWFDSQYFDIEATAAGESSDGNRVRLQSLLADRFQLTTHRETRQLPVYALVLVKSGKLGPQLAVDTAGCAESGPSGALSPSPAAASASATPQSIKCGDTSGAGGRGRVRYLGHRVQMEKLLEVLAGPASNPYVDRPIIDRTGLSGPIDFTLEFAPPQPPSPGAQAAADVAAPPQLFPTLEEQLGLKLEPQTGPVEVLVIDHVEQPSAN